MIITIDGPAGAGKSSVARRVARRLGFDFLDTGAMYRAVALALLRAGVDPADPQGLAGTLDRLRLEMPPGGKVLLNGEDVSEQIRTPEVTAASSVVAAVHAVRHLLARLQQQVAAGRNMVCEGRDQGTVVFPDAECKFFLVASPEERARRRQREMAARGEQVLLEDLLRAIGERDQRDAARDLAPMRPAPDAVIVDTTDLSLDQVVERLTSVCLARMTAG